MRLFSILLFLLNLSLTKGGRRMFPVLRVGVRGLDPETLYDFKLDFCKKELIVLDIGIFDRDIKISSRLLRSLVINIKYICTKSPLLI